MDERPACDGSSAIGMMASDRHLASQTIAPHKAARALAALWVLSLLLRIVAAGEESSDGQFVQGLRERQLFRLAESFCEKRLADAKLPLPERADLVVHLSQTCVDHARSLPPDQADPLWAKSVAATDDFARDFPRSTWRLVVGAQKGLA